MRLTIQQNIKFVIFYSIIQTFVFQQFRQFIMNVFVLLCIENEWMYEMLQLTIEFFNRRFQDSIIIREQIFNLIRKRKSTIWKIYLFFMQLVNEFDEIVFLINRRMLNIHEDTMKMLHLYKLLFDCIREFSVIRIKYSKFINEIHLFRMIFFMYLLCNFKCKFIKINSFFNLKTLINEFVNIIFFKFEVMTSMLINQNMYNVFIW